MSIAELNALLDKRHSCRAFLPDPVPQEQIAQIVTSASRVPSWCNAQPWQLIITSGDETDRFRDAMLNEAENGTPAPDLPFPRLTPACTKTVAGRAAGHSTTRLA